MTDNHRFEGYCDLLIYESMGGLGGVYSRQRWSPSENKYTLLEQISYDLREGYYDYERPDEVKQIVDRGYLFSKEGHYDKAIENYTRAIEMDPKDASFFLHRGLAYQNKLDYQKAVKDFEHYLKLAPQSNHAFELMETIEDLKRKLNNHT